MSARFPARLAAAFVIATGLGACAAYMQNPPRNDDLFRNIVPGMTQEDVSRALGKPDEMMPFPMSHTVAWDYRYYDSWGYIAYMSITFGPDGRVMSKFSRRINSGGDHSR
jgi:outer membrane protein assembly factor BamE (lipoprotein component of BamABCDE complex)